MAKAREDMNETLRLSPFEVDGVGMLDMRWWKNAESGPKPTRLAIAIKQSTITRLIWALQKVHAQIESEAAKKEAGVR
jgi:hypothetical protein